MGSGLGLGLGLDGGQLGLAWLEPLVPPEVRLGFGFGFGFGLGFRGGVRVRARVVGEVWG